MGAREKKTGKGRLDKYYHMAKEQGYRARSAFKLIQLNRKYDFLAGARCLIDLCAAPGGWLQVAAKNMPQNSIIVGVDLVAIKPIPRCVTLVEDITSDKCRRSIRAEVKDWKADVVLHDGAPNVGSAWVQDAFSQVELVLSSLKLATEFLAPGGTFVTKVFRSKDYNSLLWVFNQLFSKVEATKPPSSRNVSAEIFVVCSGYLAPAKIDPKLLNAKHVFSDYDLAPIGNPLTDVISSRKTLTPMTLNVFHPEKKRRQRDGYDEEDLLLHKECGAMQFIRSVDPIGVLALIGRIRWIEEEDKKLYKNPLTTADIKASAEDLKVLGKKDFKNLLKYRTAVREDLGLDVKVTDVQEFTDTIQVEPLDEDEQIAQELDRLTAEQTLLRRRSRRRLNERKNREIQRMQLNMVTPMELGLERHDGIDVGDMFDLGEVEGTTSRRKLGARKGVIGGPSSFADQALEDDRSSDEDDEALDDEEEEEEEDDGLDEEDRKLLRLEATLDLAYDQYHQNKSDRDARHRAKEERRKRDAAEGGEWLGINTGAVSESEDEEEQDPAPEIDSDDLDSEDEAASDDDGKMSVDEKDDDEDDEDEDGSTIEVQSKTSKAATASSALLKKSSTSKSTTAAAATRKALITQLPLSGADEKRAGEKSRAAAMWFDQPMFKGLVGLEAMMSGDAPQEEEDDEEDEQDSVMQDAMWEEMNAEDEEAEAAALKAYADKEGEDEEEEESDDDFEGANDAHVEDPNMTAEADFQGQVDAEEARRERIDKLGLTTAQAMTLAQQLVNRERTKTQMIDEGFNRHVHNVGGDGLPTWFIDDEQKHFRNNVPVTKEAVAAIREKLRALNARPIKKIAEAQARKKMRTIRRIEKTRAKTNAIAEDDELAEREKASSIAKVLSKSKSNPRPKKPEIKIVVARGLNRGNKGRPKGVSGRYKMVDPRDKKEKRALKKIAKESRKGGGRKKANK